MHPQPNPSVQLWGAQFVLDVCPPLPSHVRATSPSQMISPASASSQLGGGSPVDPLSVSDSLPLVEPEVESVVVDVAVPTVVDVVAVESVVVVGPPVVPAVSNPVSDASSSGHPVAAKTKEENPSSVRRGVRGTFQAP
jgi:hypothetical protein